MTHTGRSHSLLAAFAALAVLAGCEPLQETVRDNGPRLTPGMRWAWSAPDLDGLAPGDGDVAPTPEIATLLASAIESTLVTRGFPRTTPDSADFFVHYHLGRRIVTDTLPPLGRPERTSGGGNWDGYGRPEEIGDRTMTWREGMLIVDALRAGDGSVAWRGYLVGEVRAEVERAPEPALRDAVRRLLSQFP